jgi:malonyl-CoA O-methyltransferase
MNKTLDKSQISKNFSRAVKTYNKWAKVQNKAAEKLVSFIPDTAQFSNVLDIGCGTGILIKKLYEKFQPGEITGIDIAEEMIQYCRKMWPQFKFIQTDAEKFITEEKYDLIISNFSFQWFVNKTKSIKKYCSFLNPGGLFAISVPVWGSLQELIQSSFAVTGKEMESLRFVKTEDYLNGYINQDVKILFKMVVSTQVYYISVWDILKSFKEMGTVYRPENYQFYSFKELNKICDYYQLKYQKTDQSIPITYKVLFLILEKV